MAPPKLFLVALASATACGDMRSPAESSDISLGPVDTLISAESGILTRPADIVVSDSGRVFLLDYGGPEILRLDATDHSVVRRFGGSGAGPGELRIPLGLAIRGDTIVTTNVGNGRFEFFSTIGEPLPSRPAPAGALVGRLSLNPDGGFILPTNGSDSSLARLFHPDGRPANGVGAPIVPYDPSFDLEHSGRRRCEVRFRATIATACLLPWPRIPSSGLRSTLSPR